MIDEERLKAEEAQRKVILNLHASAAVARLMLQAKDRRRVSSPTVKSRAIASAQTARGIATAATPATTTVTGTSLSPFAAATHDVRDSEREAEGGGETPVSLVKDALNCYEQALQTMERNR